MRRAPFFDRGQLHVDTREIDDLLLAAANRYQGIGNSGQLAHIGGNAFTQRRGSGKRRALRRAQVHFELRLIVNRQKVLADEHEQRNGADNHQRRQQNDRPAMRHRPLEHPRVSAIYRTIEAALLGLGLAVFVFEFGEREFAFLTRFRKMRIVRRGGVFLARFGLPFDQARRQHRRQGERNQ